MDGWNDGLGTIPVSNVERCYLLNMWEKGNLKENPQKEISLSAQSFLLVNIPGLRSR